MGKSAMEKERERFFTPLFISDCAVFNGEGLPYRSFRSLKGFMKMN